MRLDGRRQGGRVCMAMRRVAWLRRGGTQAQKSAQWEAHNHYPQNSLETLVVGLAQSCQFLASARRHHSQRGMTAVPYHAAVA